MMVLLFLGPDIFWPFTHVSRIATHLVERRWLAGPIWNDFYNKCFAILCWLSIRWGAWEVKAWWDWSTTCIVRGNEYRESQLRRLRVFVYTWFKYLIFVSHLWESCRRSEDGTEFLLQDAQPPHLFVIREEKKTPVGTRPIAAFYILDGTVYQSPTLYDVFENRLVRLMFERTTSFHMFFMFLVGVILLS